MESHFWFFKRILSFKKFRAIIHYQMLFKCWGDVWRFIK